MEIYRDRSIYTEYSAKRHPEQAWKAFTGSDSSYASTKESAILCLKMKIDASLDFRLGVEAKKSPDVNSLTFYEWAIRLKNRDTPTGDLAKDMLRDKDAATVDNTLEAFDAHLRRQNACREAHETLRAAWRSYQAYLRRHPEG